ncbi:HAMP domain-containing protein [candidate division WOR-3 bacterium]|uniref:HAMP domain-containing protein n=1 Tax=candidate division WOR-3 bacterium TaxID=2052148 RepID=A0A9D5QDM9_UNCW3|nr:HAMP domain-containing protein [candidate division WOR-3 bacterium]MBD3364215.1 HAMP domain-containing protein [candidate division WOR-3 bacterium]
MEHQTGKRGLGLAGKLIIIFSALFGVILAGVVGTSAYLFIRSKKADAHYRVADVGKAVYTARNWMRDKDLEAYLKQTLSARFKSEAYDLSLLKVEVVSRQGKVIEVPRRNVKGDTVTVKVQDPGTGEYAVPVYVLYSVENLERGMWSLVWIVAGIGLAAFIVGVLLILVFTRRSTANLRKLAYAMEDVGEGKMGTRVEINTRDEVGVLGSRFNMMMRGLEEGEFVKNIFKRYVTRQVAEKVLAEKNLAHLEGDRRVITILFADIRGFTRLSQNMTPEEIIAMLNQYFAPVIEVIIKNEGVLDKFIGDGFLAFWNAPLPQEDHALKACKAAIEIKMALAELNAKRGAEGKLPIKVGIGIHTGEAVAGNVGSDQRMEYTIIGESVNFAERLQEAAEKGEILVSSNTRRLVNDKLRFEDRRIRIEDYGDKDISAFELLPEEKKT